GELGGGERQPLLDPEVAGDVDDAERAIGEIDHRQRQIGEAEALDRPQHLGGETGGDPARGGLERGGDVGGARRGVHRLSITMSAVGWAKARSCAPCPPLPVPVGTAHASELVELAERIRVRLCPPYAGKRAVKVEPSPGTLVTVTSPPIMRASLRVMA